MSTDEREAAHEARIERLTQLARQVWPDATHHEVVWSPDQTDEAAFVRLDGGTVVLSLDEVKRSGASLDALEAALLVLADEARIPLTADQVTRDALEGCRRDREALTRRIREERAAMEGLAEEWEQQAREPGTLQGTQRPTMESCARELRERAKGGAE